MPNFVKISRQMKKLSIQVLDYDRSVCMATICNRGPISSVSTNESLLGEKRTCAKFQIDSSEIEGLIRVYTTNRRIDG